MPPRRRSEPDEHAATELVLYMDNTNGLSLGSSQGQGRSVRENLLKRWDRGTYDFEKSIKMMGYLVESGAKQYAKEYGGTWNRLFTTATRDVAARALAEQFRNAARNGEYD